jgi:CRP/FNR family cyclic AMP-dependent transcriptional regulator
VGSIDAPRIGSFDLFAGLAEQELAFVAKNCTELTAPSGSILIREGQVGKDVYLLEEGSVRVYHGEPESPKELAVLKAPTILGEMALLDSERIRTSSVSALSNLRLLSIPIDTFLIFLGAYPSLKEKLRQLIADRR